MVASKPEATRDDGGKVALFSTGRAPAYVKTMMGKTPEVSADEYMETFDKRNGDKHALGRVGTPEEVAHCIAFLASDDAAFVTGITMPVDGGLLLLSTVSGPAPLLDTQKNA
ncbi:hypothetical protein HPB49_000855 [Dermacentor silvarum]|uniref:Uncharacterized protein n=1 Tax=Dermacentor silvarum TaxID=543639 RepID=A0ACB8D1D0_DERSI|nr:hypothetical protein HPB49_000855 [Dermacentor silvarum]